MVESGDTLETLSKQWKIDCVLAEALKKYYNIVNLFPVQMSSIPQIMNAHEKAHRISDFCISAPTGSGKTLTYVIPIVQKLKSRIVLRLRALIVVPTRDLAIQVHGILNILCTATSNLNCGIAIGQSNFTNQQNTLLGVNSVDILVATPGRLVDHLEQTPHFTLEHLQFLVIDEADGLLNQSYFDWIAKMYASLFPLQDREDSDNAALFKDHLCPRTSRSMNEARNKERIRVPLVRVLLSATLTNNPRKLAMIGMHHAEIIKIGSREKQVDLDDTSKATSQHDDMEDSAHDYVLPETLEQLQVACDTESKPLMLLALLQIFKDEMAIIFTSSLSSTHRLTRLVQLFLEAMGESPDRVCEYSSHLKQRQRKALLAKCNKGYIRVLVCSDAMARGMDLENVINVINYDVPSYIKTYVHRAGRTARAGRSGRCITLLKKGQSTALKRMLEKAKIKRPSKFPIKQDQLKEHLPHYTEALKRLKETLHAESEGTLKLTSKVRKRKLVD